MNSREPTPNEKMGMTWWNGMSRPERDAVMKRTEIALGRVGSVSEAWDLWQKGRISMDVTPDSSRLFCGRCGRGPLFSWELFEGRCKEFCNPATNSLGQIGEPS